jgi:N-acetylmuramate 1-kinase
MRDHQIQEKKQLRAAARLAFAENTLGSSLTIAPASADASFRSYFRVQNAFGETSIVMDAPPEHEDCRPFLDVCTRLVEADLHAPIVLSQDLKQGFLLLKDLGTQTLLPALNATNVDQHYQHAMDAIVRMQTQVSIDRLPAYNAIKLDAEMALFPTWFLERHLGLKIDSDVHQLIDQACAVVRTAALQQPQVFVHRDFHSRNLMLSQDEPTNYRKLAIIDFQDAVVGPITYDLVSLLRDCYIRWPDQQVSAWVAQFHQRAIANKLTSVSEQTFAYWFDCMGVQRHLKVLGIFARLHYRDGKSAYLSDLPLVLDYTISVCRRHPALSEFADWLAQVTNGVNLTVAR